MSIRIGENIRKLRKEKGITQEILADHLAVTPQAISRWESGAGYPGIDYLPDLAGFFGISVDELLGVKLSEREARREHYYRVIERIEDGADPEHGYDRPAVDLLREAHAEFPGDRKIRLALARALFRPWREGRTDQANIQEAEILLRVLIRQADDQAFRFTCICELASLYKEARQDERGYQEVLELLPGLESSREYFITNFCGGAVQKPEEVQDCILKLIQWTSNVLRDYIAYFLSNDPGSFDRKINALNRVIAGVEEAGKLLGKEKARRLLPNISALHRYAATYHMARDEQEKALACLEESCCCDESFCTENPAEASDYAEKQMRYLEQGRYDPIRDNRRFQAVQERLSGLAGK